MQRCHLCPGKNTCVPPDGPVDPGKLCFVGEAPGKDEDRYGKPFIGKTGKEVNEHYLPLAGLRRQTVHFTNSIRCLPPSTGGKLDPKSRRDLDLLESCCNHYLYPEITALRPRLIIPMGGFACRAIDPSINLDLQHGIPMETSWGTTFPMYHPAGGLHVPKAMLHIRTDWTRLRKYLAGTLNIPVDPYEGLEDYRHLTHPDEVDEILVGEWRKVMACDTENKRGGDPFCLTFSVTPGTGYLIMSDDEACLARFQEHLDLWKGRILWHNWLHDNTITNRMKLRFKPHLITDTMCFSFHLGNLPQGLKALAYRELGMKMTDFDDVVSPHSAKLVLRYYHEMYRLEWPKPPVQMVRGDGGEMKPYRPHSMKTKLKVFYTYYEKSSGEKDVFEAWDNWEPEWEVIEERMESPWPGKCISHVPFEEGVIPYACRDADALLRLYPKLVYASRYVRNRPQQDWMDGYV